MAGGMKIEVTEDNSEEILEEMKRKVALALEAIGGEAEMFAKQNCPVDTGRLRNSITFVTSEAQGSPNTSGGQAAEPGDYSPNSTPEDDRVYIGTNVSYAPEQEYYGKNKHFLKDAATGHADRYQKIAETIMKE
jgi:hypothetical protein